MTTSALEKNGLSQLILHIEGLLENHLSEVVFYIPTANEKISSWIYNNSHVYKRTYIYENFVGNKINAKISKEKLNFFKSKFPEIKINNL